MVSAPWPGWFSCRRPAHPDGSYRVRVSVGGLDHIRRVAVPRDASRSSPSGCRLQARCIPITAEASATLGFLTGRMMAFAYTLYAPADVALTSAYASLLLLAAVRHVTIALGAVRGHRAGSRGICSHRPQPPCCSCSLCEDYSPTGLHADEPAAFRGACLAGPGVSLLASCGPGGSKA